MSKRQSNFTQSVKMFFGIFMVFVYMGMAVLLMLNVFDWSVTPLWTAVRWFFALVFAAYGLYRGYREVKGEHSYGMRIHDDDEDDEQVSYYEKKKQEDEKN